jgi:hypothetical protein
MNYKPFLSIYGSYEQIMIWTIGEVVLPFGPEKLEYSKKCDKEAVAQTGDEPMNIVDGLNTGISLGGSIADDSKADAEIWDTYLTPLLALIGKQVTILCPITGLNGEWLLDSFIPTRDSKLSIYKYTLRLSKGSLNINIAEYDD